MLLAIDEDTYRKDGFLKTGFVHENQS